MEQLSPDHLFAVTERTAVVVLRRPPTVALLATLEARVKAAARTYSPPLGYLHVVLDVPTTGKVEDSVRGAFIEFAKRTMHLTNSAAMVLLRDGFAGAAMRAMVSGALMVVRPTVPVRIFGDVRSATLWLSSSAAAQGQTRDAAALQAKVLEMQSLLLREFAP